LDLLTTISTIAPHHVSETTLPLLFASLPDHPPGRADATARDRYWSTLTSLTQLCTQPALFETLVVRLSTKLELLCTPASEVTDVEPAAAYAHALLTTLANVLEKKVERGDVDVPKYIDRLVPRVCNLFFYAALADDKKNLVMTDSRLVSVASRIVNLIGESLSVRFVAFFFFFFCLPPQKVMADPYNRKQESFVGALVSAYMKGDTQQVASGYLKLPLDRAFSPFNVCTVLSIAEPSCLYGHSYPLLSVRRILSRCSLLQ